MKLKYIGFFICLFLFVTTFSAHADLNSDLIIEAGFGEVDTVRILLNRGADVNTKDNYGFTPLIFAAKYGHTTTVKLLLTRGADVNVKSKLLGYTALMNAAAFGDIEMVKALLERGADVNARNNEGVTALTFAQEAGKSDIIELLKKHSARK